MGRRREYTHYDASGHPQIERVCDLCGDAYLGRLQGSRFCSRQCSGRASNPARTTASREGYLKCVRCEIEKPEDQFGVYQRSPTGRKASCKACRAAEWQRSKTPELLERRRDYRRRYYAAHPDKKAAREAAIREWVREHPESRKATAQLRAARVRSARIVSFAAADLAAKWDYWAGKCWLCGDEAVEWDHVKPIARGGLHALANLRPACRICNATKSAKWHGPRGFTRE